MTMEIKNERNHVMTTAALPRMRTIPQAFKEIKSIDPNTSITVSVLRRLVKEGAIETVTIEHKRLINMDLLFSWLSCYNERATHCCTTNVQ
ncbi:MAG: hypothetical protein IJU56_05585 [Clostridia bacterium]|nr:hypothetical protein [Clostridia bacterium]